MDAARQPLAAFALGPNTADLLEEFGFAYDSSLFGHDEPYRPRVPTVTGRLRGTQVKAGLPWQVVLEPETIATLRAYVARARRVKRCKKEAS